MNKSTIGIYGLGVMGRNLALNLEDQGNRVSVYNRPLPGEEDVVSDFINSEGRSKSFVSGETIQEFVSTLETPRKILMMVKAGPPVDGVINELLPHLDHGDIIIDGGNSHFEDTQRRFDTLSEKGIHFVGMGVSGGEVGARKGPSLMPGTAPEAWKMIQPIFKPIAARAFDGSPCCARIGNGGAGHFVKMVHNGIEYADMQLIAEAFSIMKNGFGMYIHEISNRFKQWNEGPLASYLFEITADILTVNDSDGTPLVEKILDSAGQKGTGKWTAISALDLGVPLPGITGAVNQRFISSLTKLRSSLSKNQTRKELSSNQKEGHLQHLEDALYASRIMCHAEGFYMITQTSSERSWDISPEEVARIWQGGCIIRSELLRLIVAAFQQHPHPDHLLLADSLAAEIEERNQGWRSIINYAIQTRIPVPVISGSLSQYDSLRSGKLPANLIQAQRDYFGAHTYERTDKPRGEFFHTDWTKKKTET